MFCCAFIITGNKIKKTVIIVFRTSIFESAKKTTRSVGFKVALVKDINKITLRRYNEEEL